MLLRADPAQIYPIIGIARLKLQGWCWLRSKISSYLQHWPEEVKSISEDSEMISLRLSLHLSFPSISPHPKPSGRVLCYAKGEHIEEHRWAQPLCNWVCPFPVPFPSSSQSPEGIDGICCIWGFHHGSNYCNTNNKGTHSPICCKAVHEKRQHQCACSSPICGLLASMA